ncbi:cytochrome P450 [Xylaria venustula]|nr:cytochrome P450 [Xylaria venustula]
MACPYKPGGSATTPEQHEAKENAIVPIPQPPTHWFTGNLREMDPAFPASSFWRLAEVYGDIFKLDLVARKAVILSSYELINEVMDETRFRKKPSGPLRELRALLGDGLFTAYWNEENWGKAHRILMPVFGPIQIRKMFPDMVDLVSQLVLKLDRMGPDNEIYRLAFDMIGICGFGYRFNSFYRDEIHPFAREMAAALVEAGKRSNRTQVENYLRVKSAEELDKNIHSMWKLCDELVAERKRNPKPEARDLLNTMLNASDPQTGEKLSDENIRFNMVTFLVAGHETTSGTLSFLFYNLLKNPETYHKAQQEVDRVLGDGVLKPEHLTQFKYIEACIRETMRITSTITILNIAAIEDTVIGGKYRVTTDDTLVCNVRGMHHDRRVWGEDADVFRPDRLLDGKWEKLPPNAWKPFGNGARACIGRFFAEQEMIIATAMLLQRFQVSMVDPSYNLRLKATLTVKPEGFKIKVVRRPGKSATVGIPGNVQVDVDKVSQSGHVAATQSFKGTGTGQSLLILYGSNAGTCKYLAEDLDMAARNRGLNATVKTMDEGTEQLSKDTPVVIITPSYEGKPADNARKFVAWLETGKSDSLKDVQYAVFGSGNSEWMNTFQRIPKLVNETMAKLGAKRIIAAQFVDAKEDATGPWEDWRDELLAFFTGGAQPVVAVGPELEVIVQKPEVADVLAGEQISTALVRENKQIASPEVGSAKNHMEIELPEGVTYEPGDYLAVLPTNPPDQIKRVTTQFNLNMDDIITIKGTSKAFLSSERPSTVIEILGTRVELGTPASKRQIEAIAKTASEADQQKLQALISSPEVFAKEVVDKRLSVIDLLEDHPSAKLSFAAYLDMLRPLTPRQYSISSSPLAALSDKTERATLTYDVHKAPARSGQGRQFHGVASTYLATRTPGSRIRCVVRRSNNTGFHLPRDASTPLIMVAAGTGIAPFRGFVQQRACIGANNPGLLGPALLYFGCRDFERDFLYAEELREWEGLGAVQVRPAFSRRGPVDENGDGDGDGDGGYKYTHERMWEEREELRDLFRRGAKIFVCGSANKLARSTNEVTKRIWRSAFPDRSEEDAQRWLEGIREVRYVSDVFD